MTLHIKPCPVCKGSNVSVLPVHYRGFQVVCLEQTCPARSDTAYGSIGMGMNDIQKQAIQSWNEVER